MISDQYVRHIRSRIAGQSIEQIDLEIVEVLKFLAIVSASTGRRFPLTQEADQVWHELILQTGLYARLCRELPGGHFLHHESITPVEYHDRVGDDTFVREWVQWVPDYVQNFGPFVGEAARAWNVVVFLQNEMRLSLQEINDLGQSEAPSCRVPGKVGQQLNLLEARLRATRKHG